MLGVCYYPEHWPQAFWAEDARRMREMGIAYVRIGEFAWSRLEPSRGDFDWDWLDRAFDVLGGAGLKIVLGTPTATPPKWLMDEHPEIAPIDEQGRPRGFGSRRHYTFSSPVYIRESARIVEALARRYGGHAALAGWQTDNEYGCHGTVLSWGPHDLAAFRDWLRRRYQTPDELNAAWGKVFWSMEVAGFEDVALPNLAVTETNPAARLDFRRFASEQVRAFNRMQADIIRRHSPGRLVTHNFMGFFTDFDHFALAEHLDFASVGFLSDRLRRALSVQRRRARPLGGDLASRYRAVPSRSLSRGRARPVVGDGAAARAGELGALEPDSGARHGEALGIEAHAHGAEVVCYFRWRQAPFAQEQMHAGLNLPDRSGLSPGGREAADAARELAKLGELPATAARPSRSCSTTRPTGSARSSRKGPSFRYLELAFRWYEAVASARPRRRHRAPRRSPRRLRARARAEPADRLRGGGGRVRGGRRTSSLFGPRSGSKTRHFAIPDDLPPGPLPRWSRCG